MRSAVRLPGRRRGRRGARAQAIGGRPRVSRARRSDRAQRIGKARGGGVAAASTLAGGSAARQAAGYQATQLREQEGTEIGAAQRTALDTQAKARMLESSAVARAAAGGINAGFGSPVSTVGDIASRG